MSWKRFSVSFLSRSIGIGTDGDFKGVYNRKFNRVELYDGSKGDHGASMVKVSVTSVDDPDLGDVIGADYQLADERYRTFGYRW